MKDERTKGERSKALGLVGLLTGLTLLALLPVTLVSPAAADDWTAGDEDRGNDRWGESPDRGEDLRDLMEQALRELEDQLKDTLESIPLYDLPEITEDGDIIIRRLPPLDLDRDRPQRREDADPDIAEISV